MAGMMRAFTRGLLRWSLVLALIVAWQILTETRTFTPFMLPSPVSVLERISRDAMSGDLATNVLLTVYRALSGFVIAAVLGVTLGLVMTRNAGVRWFFDPLISVGIPMPKITFLPVVVLWLGFYDTAKISMVVFDAIFPVITATIAGVQSVEKELIWSARNLGARERELMWQVLLPAASPQIITGLQVALPIALIVAVVAEMMMGGYGMGGAMIQASRMADSRGVFAGIVEISVVGWVLVKLMTLLRTRLLAWHAEGSRDAA
jgi:ABC-type nitrate/sulfonate/bicarbonate transport system permease component